MDCKDYAGYSTVFNIGQNQMISPFWVEVYLTHKVVDENIFMNHCEYIMRNLQQIVSFR